MTEQPGWQVDLQTDRAHSARVYDYILGGKDNYAADRAVAEGALRGWPALRTSMLANRAFMRKIVLHLAGECGVRQFLDIGTGLPTAPNLHEVAQSVAPDSRILYTDNDPIVLAHAQALLGSAPEGRTTYLAADMREPLKILAAPQLLETLDLSKPVALTIIAMMQTIDDDEVAHRVVRVLMDALPVGSYLAMSMPTDEIDPGPIAEIKRQYEARGEVVRFRSKAEVEAFFQGLELVEPGIVQVHKWRPGPNDVAAVSDSDVNMYGGLARKSDNRRSPV